MFLLGKFPIIKLIPKLCWIKDNKTHLLNSKDIIKPQASSYMNCIFRTVTNWMFFYITIYSPKQC